MSKIPEKYWIRVKIEDAITPKDGHIAYVNRWWGVKDGHILFYLSYNGPQCNSNQHIAEYLDKKFDRTSQFIPVVYVPHNCNDYV